MFKGKEMSSSCYTKKLLSIVLVIALLFQLCGCGIAAKAKKTANSVADGLSSAKDAVVTWYQNMDLSLFEKGWNSVSGFVGTAYSAAISATYVGKVSAAIANLKVDINSAAGSARGIAQEAGFAAERWVAGTFNINAAARESSYSAEVVGSNALGSVDVATNYGEEASLKFYQNASGSAQAQAKTLIEAYTEYSSHAQGNSTKEPMSLQQYMDSHGYDYESQNDLLASIYQGQTRIIPADQMAEATAFLQGKIDKLSAIDGDVSSARTKAYQETLYNLRDRLRSPDGTTSKPISNKDMQAIAELSQKGEFAPEDFGITLSQAISPMYVLKQAMGTGLRVGILKTVFTVGPDLVSIIAEAIKTGAVNEDALAETGFEGAIAMSSGFVEGSLCRIITTLCQEGTFGAALKSASPTVVAALVFLTIEAMISGYSLVKGTISASEYGYLMADKSMTTLLAIPATSMMLSVLPHTTFFILLGCFAGAIIASAGYSAGKEVVLEFADGGGFGALVPVGVANRLSSFKQAITSINFKGHLSNLKGFAVTTAENGLIYVKNLFA